MLNSSRTGYFSNAFYRQIVLYSENGINSKDGGLGMRGFGQLFDEAFLDT